MSPRHSRPYALRAEHEDVSLPELTLSTEEVKRLSIRREVCCWVWAGFPDMSVLLRLIFPAHLLACLGLPPVPALGGSRSHGSRRHELLQNAQTSQVLGPPSRMSIEYRSVVHNSQFGTAYHPPGPCTLSAHLGARVAQIRIAVPALSSASGHQPSTISAPTVAAQRQQQ